MSTEGLQPVLVDQYGGLVTLIDRSDLPIGVSPDCQNVEFFPGGVRSRSGFSSYLTTGSSTVGMMSGFLNNGRVLLLLMSNGTMQYEAPEASLNNIGFGDFGASTTAMCGTLDQARLRGTLLFGRFYFNIYATAFYGTSVVGINGPYSFNGAVINPVSQEGPPGSFTVTPSAGGTMSAGRHDFVVVYETSDGYVTPPSDVVGNTFTAGQDADLAAIPVGPGQIYRRIVFATPANSTSFYTLPRFAINDNATTTLSGLTFTDAELMSGTSLEDYLDAPPLAPGLGVEKYGQRLAYWGTRPRLNPFFDMNAATGAPMLVGLQSLSFDNSNLALPYPWTASVAGGSVVKQPGAALQCYKIIGDGVNATRGTIAQRQPNVAGSGTFYLTPGRKYTVSARVNRDSGATKGCFHVELWGYTGGGVGTLLGEASWGVSALPTQWYVAFGGALTAPTSAHVSVEAKVYVDDFGGLYGTLENGQSVYVDWIEVSEAVDSERGSVIRMTNPGDPGTANEATGLVQVAPNDGQEIRDLFELRGNLYVAKEHSLYVTTDNGDEPVNWTVDQVSNTVGTPSPHGVGLGDGWAIIASRNGCYYFTGGEPQKISQEIQTTWDSINWKYGVKLWAVVDSQAKRVYIGVPYGAATSVDRILVLDYVDGFGDPVEAGGSGRKWSVWTPAFTHGIMAERDALTQTFLGASGTTIAKYDSSAKTDWSGAITSYYETAPIGTEIGRSLFDRLIMRIRGSGSLLTQSRSPGGTLTTLPTKTLSAAPDDDVEIKFHELQTQVGFRITTSGATDYWNLRRLGVFLKPSTYSYLRKT